MNKRETKRSRLQDRAAEVRAQIKRFIDEALASGAPLDASDMRSLQAAVEHLYRMEAEL